MRISDWSSDVCSSDLDRPRPHHPLQLIALKPAHFAHRLLKRDLHLGKRRDRRPQRQVVVQHMVLAHIAVRQHIVAQLLRVPEPGAMPQHQPGVRPRSEEHTSELQSLMRISYAVFCLKKKNKKTKSTKITHL